MNFEISKTLSTCAIWAATAAIFIFGLFKMNGGDVFFLGATLIFSLSSAGATAQIWHTPKDQAQNAQPPVETKQ